MKKPEKQQGPSYYDYHDLMKYLEEKYNFQSRDFYGKYRKEKFDESVVYADFWHWLTGKMYDISNGSYGWLCPKEWLEEDLPDFVRAILTYIDDEFCQEEAEIVVRFSW